MKFVLLSATFLLAACGSAADPNTAVDAVAGGLADAPNAPIDAVAAITFPTWMLEDIQPASPMTGQTYGLQTFTGKVVVVTLLEGF